jgi:hypothetical protein
MTTTASAGASSAPTIRPQPQPWPPRVALLDCDGRLLSEADVPHQDDEGSVRLAEVAKPDALLGYYFGKSGRRLMVDLGDLVVDGWLETRWDGDRRSWWIEPGEGPTS